MGRRITKSHPDWEGLNQAANDLAITINPHMFFWGLDENGQPTIIDEVERKATVEGEDLQIGSMQAPYLSEANRRRLNLNYRKIMPKVHAH